MEEWFSPEKSAFLCLNQCLIEQDNRNYPVFLYEFEISRFWNRFNQIKFYDAIRHIC